MPCPYNVGRYYSSGPYSKGRSLKVSALAGMDVAAALVCGSYAAIT